MFPPPSLLSPTMSTLPLLLLLALRIHSPYGDFTRRNIRSYCFPAKTQLLSVLLEIEAPTFSPWLTNLFVIQTPPTTPTSPPHTLSSARSPSAGPAFLLLFQSRAKLAPPAGPLHLLFHCLGCASLAWHSACPQRGFPWPPALKQLYLSLLLHIDSYYLFFSFMYLFPQRSAALVILLMAVPLAFRTAPDLPAH